MMSGRGPTLPPFLVRAAAQEAAHALAMAPSQVVTETSEIGTSVPLVISGLISGAGRGTEQPVFQSKKAWKAIDVFVTPMPTLAGPQVPTGYVSVFVYAHVQGARVLVSSGRIKLTGQSGQTVPFNVPIWIAAARMASAQFEVTCCPEEVSGSTDPGRLLIVCACSDSEAPIPPGLGEVSEVLETSYGIAFTPPLKLEIVGLSANSQAGAAAWVHVHDFVSPPANANGFTPLVSYALDTLAAGGGFSVVDRAIRVRVRGSLVVVLSSTRTVTTGAAGGLSVTVR
jgi:hypothetical protein